MKVMVGGIRKGLYDRYDVKELLSDNRLLDEMCIRDSYYAYPILSFPFFFI